jgi:hypothetical protein
VNLDQRPNLVGVINVARERGSDDVGVLVNDLDDVGSNLVRFILDDGGVGPVVDVEIEKLS